MYKTDFANNTSLYMNGVTFSIGQIIHQILPNL